MGCHPMLVHVRVLLPGFCISSMLPSPFKDTPRCLANINSSLLLEQLLLGHPLAILLGNIFRVAYFADRFVHDISLLTILELFSTLSTGITGCSSTMLAFPGISAGQQSTQLCTTGLHYPHSISYHHGNVVLSLLELLLECSTHGLIHKEYCQGFKVFNILCSFCFLDSSCRACLLEAFSSLSLYNIATRACLRVHAALPPAHTTRIYSLGRLWRLGGLDRFLIFFSLPLCRRCPFLLCWWCILCAIIFLLLKPVGLGQHLLPPPPCSIKFCSLMEWLPLRIVLISAKCQLPFITCKPTYDDLSSVGQVISRVDQLPSVVVHNVHPVPHLQPLRCV